MIATKELTLSDFLNNSDNKSSGLFEGKNFKNLLSFFEEENICPFSPKENDLFKAMKKVIEEEKDLINLFSYWKILARHKNPSLFKKLGGEIEECFKLIVRKQTKDSEQIVSLINHCGNAKNIPPFIRESLQKLL